MLSSSSGHSTITHQHTTAACIPVRAISYWHQYFRLTAIDISVKPTARLGGVSWASKRTGYILQRIDILGLANLHVANNSKDENGSTPRADHRSSPLHNLRIFIPSSVHLYSAACAHPTQRFRNYIAAGRNILTYNRLTDTHLELSTVLIYLPSK